MSCVDLIDKWLLEYACAQHMSQVLRVYGEQLSTNPMLLAPGGQCCVSLRFSTYTLYAMVCNKTQANYEEALQILQHLYEVCQEEIPILKFIKVSTGLKILVLFEMLKKGNLLALPKLNAYFPRAGFFHPRADKRLSEKLSIAQHKFRKLMLTLISSDLKRHQYFRDEFEEEFGKQFHNQLQKLTLAFISDVERKAPPTMIDRLLLCGVNSPFAMQMARHGGISMEILLDALQGNESLEEEQVMEAYKMLHPLICKDDGDGPPRQGKQGWDDLLGMDTSEEEVEEEEERVPQKKRKTVRATPQRVKVSKTLSQFTDSQDWPFLGSTNKENKTVKRNSESDTSPVKSPIKNKQKMELKRELNFDDDSSSDNKSKELSQKSNILKSPSAKPKKVMSSTEKSPQKSCNIAKKKENVSPSKLVKKSSLKVSALKSKTKSPKSRKRFPIVVLEKSLKMVGGKGSVKVTQQLIRKFEKRKTPLVASKRSQNKSPEKSQKKSPEKPQKKSPKKSQKKSPDKAQKKLPEKSPKKSPEKLMKKLREKSLKRSPKISQNESQEKSLRKSPKQSPRKSSEKSLRKSPENSPRKIPVKSAKKNSKKFVGSKERGSPCKAKKYNVQNDAKSRKKASTRVKSDIKNSPSKQNKDSPVVPSKIHFPKYLRRRKNVSVINILNSSSDESFLAPANFYKSPDESRRRRLALEAKRNAIQAALEETMTPVSKRSASKWKDTDDTVSTDEHGNSRRKNMATFKSPSRESGQKSKPNFSSSEESCSVDSQGDRPRQRWPLRTRSRNEGKSSGDKTQSSGSASESQMSKKKYFTRTTSQQSSDKDEYSSTELDSDTEMLKLRGSRSSVELSTKQSDKLRRKAILQTSSPRSLRSSPLSLVLPSSSPSSKSHTKQGDWDQEPVRKSPRHHSTPAGTPGTSRGTGTRASKTNKQGNKIQNPLLISDDDNENVTVTKHFRKLRKLNYVENSPVSPALCHYHGNNDSSASDTSSPQMDEEQRVTSAYPTSPATHSQKDAMDVFIDLVRTSDSESMDRSLDSIDGLIVPSSYSMDKYDANVASGQELARRALPNFSLHLQPYIKPCIVKLQKNTGIEIMIRRKKVNIFS